MPFNQTFGTVNNVYNVEGSLILTANSSPQDLAAQLAALRSEIAAMAGLPEPHRRAVESELAAAEAASAAPSPDGATIKSHLDKAGATLESAAGFAERAGAFAKTVFSVGKWAFALFA
jgi:chromosomal replication initiation ATPase DnaA